MKFEDTPWSLILSAQETDLKGRQDALNKLCMMYWKPLYAYARARGQLVEDAQDVVQSFFEIQLQRDFLKALDPQKGHFRSYLLAAITNHMLNDWTKSTRKKRGAGRTLLPFDANADERLISSSLDRPITPEQVYEREWALVLMQKARDRTRRIYVELDSVESFDVMKPYISVDQERPSYAELVSQLGASESAVKSSLHRLRGRFRDAMRYEVRKIVESPHDETATDEEIRYLTSLFSS